MRSPSSTRTARPGWTAVRRAGDVLLWEEGGVTYRIEGAPSLDEALAVAGSLR